MLAAAATAGAWERSYRPATPGYYRPARNRPENAMRPAVPVMSEQPFYMHNLDSSVNDHQLPSSFQNASGRTGLRLVLPPLSAVKALKGKKKGSRGVAFQEPKAPRPVKLKPLKEVLTKLIAQINK